MCLRYLCAVAFCVSTVSVGSAQNSLKEEDLQRIKSATVYIKVGGPKFGASGSGFLVKVDGETGYLVTNNHVIDHSDGVPGEMATKNISIDVVFDSGTAKERSFKAAVAAADPDRDLAVLKVQAVKNLPTPLDITGPPKIFETMKVYVCGFPFGGRLADGNKNPEISIGEATISSIRSEVAGGPISKVQVNGALNPGNSGGPLVSTDGKLVGVAVTTVRGAGIGNAIPQHEVVSLLRGRVGRVLLLPAKMDAETKDEIPAKLEVGLLDPLSNVKSATAYILPGSKPLPKAMPTPGPIPDAMKVPLKIADGRATADVTVPDGGKKGLIVQLELELTEGKLFTNAVTVLVGPSGPGSIGRPTPTDPNGPQRTPDGNIKLASGVVLPFPSTKFPTPSGSESVSNVNAAPDSFVGKSLRLDALTACVINPADKNEFELAVETDAENAPTELRVVLPKDLALQIADLGIPELTTIVLQVKFPVRVNGKLSKPVGRERRYAFLAESIEFLNEDGKTVSTFRPESTLPSGKHTLAALNRFPDKFVGQTLTVEAMVKGARYSGGTGLDIATQNLASPLNLEVYTSRSLAGQVESDIAKADLPARVRLTVEVKAVNGKNHKGVIGIKQVEVLGEGDKTVKALKASDTVEYPNIPGAAKPTTTPPQVKSADATKPAEVVAAQPAAANAGGGDNTILIVALAGAVVLVLGGGFVLMMALRKPKAGSKDDDEDETPAPKKTVAKKASVSKPIPKPSATPSPRASRPQDRGSPAKADDNPFSNFE